MRQTRCAVVTGVQTCALPIYIFLNEVVARSDCGIDLHSAAIHRCNLPQIRVDSHDEEALRLAQAFGAPIIVHSTPHESSLRRTAHEKGVPVIVYEGGEGLRVDELSVSVGVRGVLHVIDRKSTSLNSSH